MRPVQPTSDRVPQRAVEHQSNISRKLECSIHTLRSELPPIMPASRNRHVRLARPLLSSGVPRRLGSHMRLRSPRPQIPLRQLSSVQRQLEMVLWMRLPCVSQHEAHPRLRVPARFRHLRRTVTVPPTPTTAVLQLKSSRPQRLPQPG